MYTSSGQYFFQFPTEFVELDPSLLHTRNKVGCAPIDCIRDLALLEELSQCQGNHYQNNQLPNQSRKGRGNMMDLPTTRNPKVSPLLEMLTSDIYTNPLCIEELEKYQEKKNNQIL